MARKLDALPRPPVPPEKKHLLHKNKERVTRSPEVIAALEAMPPEVRQELFPEKPPEEPEYFYYMPRAYTRDDEVVDNIIVNKRVTHEIDEDGHLDMEKTELKTSKVPSPVPALKEVRPSRFRPNGAVTYIESMIDSHKGSRDGCA